MEPNILDLRQQRCPMALLLAKRHTAQMKYGDELTILIADSGSKQDIEKYLTSNGFFCRIETASCNFSLKIMKGLD